MILHKATDSNHNLINELLILSNRNSNQGYAFPRGDIEDVENELKAYEQSVNDCFYIIKDNIDSIGIIGFIESEGRGIIIGPVLYEKYHTIDKVNQSIELLLNMDICKQKKITCDILKDNIILSNVLLNNNFKVTSSHITMRIQLDEYSIKNNVDFSNIIQINLQDKIQLNEIHNIFQDTLSDWKDESVDSLIDYLNEDYQIKAILDNDKRIIGSIIWVWFHELGYGRIEYIAIHKAEQRKGFGSILIDYVYSELLKQLNHELPNYFYLDLNEQNKEAYELYLKKGFEVNYLDSVYTLQAN